MKEVKECEVKEFLNKYLKNFDLENYFIYEEDLGYMYINRITLQDGSVTIYYNEEKDYIEIDNNDNFCIYEIS